MLNKLKTDVNYDSQFIILLIDVFVSGTEYEVWIDYKLRMLFTEKSKSFFK